jgi:hypothetical protein
MYISIGYVNMFYQPLNTILLGATAAQAGAPGSAFPFFPTATGVNGAFIAPCGYRCGFQSDAKLVNFVWEQSDASEDRAFVRQMSVDTTNATPVVTLGGSFGELESGNQVSGDAILNLDSFGNLNAVVRSKFDFLEGDVSKSGLSAGDLGVDSAGKGGGLLIVYAKTTAGSGGNGLTNVGPSNSQGGAGASSGTPNGTGFNRDIIAVEWDGSALSNRTVIGRGVFEGGQAVVAANQFPRSAFVGAPTAPLNLGGSYVQNTGGGNFSVNANGLGQTAVPAVTGVGGHALHANLANGGVGSTMIQVPANPSITNTPTLSPKESYIYFFDVNGDNADTGVGLYTRTFNHQIRTQANTTTNFGDQFVPAAGTSANPPSADFVLPQRMDHMTGGDVKGIVSINVTGTTSAVTFFQDGHVWLSGTTDGVSQPYTNDGTGSADPFLVDNDTSASTQFAQVVNYGDSTCGTLHHSIFFFGKNDLSQTNGSAAGASANGGSGGGGFGVNVQVTTNVTANSVLTQSQLVNFTTSAGGTQINNVPGIAGGLMPL